MTERARLSAVSAALAEVPQNRPGVGNETTRFQPGQSGNPGGRPKGLAAKIRELAPPDKLAEFYLAILDRDGKKLRSLGIKVGEVTLADRLKAGDWLADRGYGKAPQHSLVEGGDPLELTGVDAAIAGVMDELAARREASAPSAPATGEVDTAG